jgi:hypothetical protein
MVLARLLSRRLHNGKALTVAGRTDGREAEAGILPQVVGGGGSHMPRDARRICTSPYIALVCTYSS